MLENSPDPVLPTLLLMVAYQKEQAKHKLCPTKDVVDIDKPAWHHNLHTY